MKKIILQKVTVRCGFSLMELRIVIVIIGILAAGSLIVFGDKGEKAKIRHILIKPEITASDEIRVFDFALTLKDSLLNFDTFKQFAKTYSDDKITKDIGGDLGWVDLSNFPIPEFALAVQTVSSISVCSSPIKTSAGYHLIWISDVRPGGKPNLFGSLA